MKEQTLTAEGFLETSIPPQEIIMASDDFCYTPIEVSWHMEQYAKAKVLEALEEVKTHIEKQPKLYPLSLWAKLSIMKDEATKQK